MKNYNPRKGKPPKSGAKVKRHSKSETKLASLDEPIEYKHQLDDLKIDISVKLMSILSKINTINASATLSNQAPQSLNAFDYEGFILRTHNV